MICEWRGNFSNFHNFVPIGLDRIDKALVQAKLQQCGVDPYMRDAYSVIIPYCCKKIG